MHGYKLDTEWQKKRPIRNLTDCLRELNLTAESPCLQLVCELLHAANLQISHQLEQFRADNEETRWDERSEMGSGRVQPESARCLARDFGSSDRSRQELAETRP